MSKQFVPMEKAILVKEISAIGKIGNKLNARIQAAALNAIFYSITEGYIQYGQNLVLALNNGQRKNSLVAFLEKHGQFQWSKETKNLVYRKNDKLSVETIEAIDERWFEAIKAPEPKSMYDFEEDVSKFIKRMEKAVTEKATIAHIEVMDYIKAAIDQYHKDQTIADEAEFGDEEQTELQELLSVAMQSSVEGAPERSREIRKVA